MRDMLNFDDAPQEPIKRLMWLSGAAEQARQEIDAEWRLAYFEARLSGRLAHALSLGYHSRKRIMAFTRAENEARGRMIKSWGDRR